jgi:hypothetical protein
MVQPPLQDGAPGVPQVTIEKLARRQEIYLVTSVEGLFTPGAPATWYCVVSHTWQPEPVPDGPIRWFADRQPHGDNGSIAVGSDLLPPCSIAARASCRLGGQS